MEPYLTDLFVASAHDQRLRAPGWLLRAYLHLFGPPLMKPLRVRMAERLVKGYDWRGARVLDVGCGIGDLGFRLAARGADVVGVELDPAKVAYASRVRDRWGFRKLRFIAADATHIERLGIGRCDAAFCLAVLEHVEDDIGLLRQVAALLRPGGLFVLEVPNANRQTILEVEVADGHARPGYHPWKVEALLATAGLRLVSACSLDPLGLSYYWWRCSLPGSRVDRWLYTALAPLFQTLIRLTSAVIKRPGSELCFLAIRAEADDVPRGEAAC
jgi:SAM-dependent methyltransferase